MNGSTYSHRDGLWARAANLLASGWLIVSGFAWEHAAPRTNAAVVGYLVFVIAVVATTFDEIRSLNTVLGLWLVVSAWVLPGGTLVLRGNTALIGLVIVALSLVTKSGALRPPSLRALVARLEPHEAPGR
jgi:hypothetical protein